MQQNSCFEGSSVQPASIEYWYIIDKEENDDEFGDFFEALAEESSSEKAVEEKKVEVVNKAHKQEDIEDGTLEFEKNHKDLKKELNEEDLKAKEQSNNSIEKDVKEDTGDKKCEIKSTEDIEHKNESPLETSNPVEGTLKLSVEDKQVVKEENNTKDVPILEDTNTVENTKEDDELHFGPENYDENNVVKEEEKNPVESNKVREVKVLTDKGTKELNETDTDKAVNSVQKDKGISKEKEELKEENKKEYEDFDLDKGKEKTKEEEYKDKEIEEVKNENKEELSDKNKEETKEEGENIDIREETKSETVEQKVEEDNENKAQDISNNESREIQNTNEPETINKTVTDEIAKEDNNEEQKSKEVVVPEESIQQKDVEIKQEVEPRSDINADQVPEDTNKDNKDKEKNSEIKPEIKEEEDDFGDFEEAEESPKNDKEPVKEECTKESTQPTRELEENKEMTDEEDEFGKFEDANSEPNTQGEGDGFVNFQESPVPEVKKTIEPEVEWTLDKKPSIPTPNVIH